MPWTNWTGWSGVIASAAKRNKKQTEEEKAEERRKIARETNQQLSGQKLAFPAGLKYCPNCMACIECHN